MLWSKPIYDINNKSHFLVVEPVKAKVVANHQINSSLIKVQINNQEFMVAAYGNASSIQEGITEAATWNLRPNPSNAVVRMRAGAAPCEVYDAAGQLVQPWSSPLIDVSEWLVGRYSAVQANGRSARFNVVH